MRDVTSDEQRGVKSRAIRLWRFWFVALAMLICVVAVPYWYEAWVQRHLKWQRVRIETLFDAMSNQPPPADCPHYEHGLMTIREAFQVKVQRPYHSVFRPRGYRWTVPPGKLSQFEIDLVELTRKVPPSRELLWKTLDLVEALTPPNYFTTNRRLTLEDDIGPRTTASER